MYIENQENGLKHCIFQLYDQFMIKRNYAKIFDGFKPNIIENHRNESYSGCQ